MNNSVPQSRSKGFTIMELMVATLVFSAVLLLITTGIMQITRVYYKGVTEANTQNTARNIMDIVAQAIQFSGSSVGSTEDVEAGEDAGFCIGNQHFTYRLGWQVENKDNPDGQQTWHALVQKTIYGSNCSGSAVLEALNSEHLSEHARDLVGEHMRLSDFSVTRIGTSNMYRVRVKVVYGDADLLNDPTGKSASCQNIRVGGQFCAVADLSTVVVKRVGE